MSCLLLCLTEDAKLNDDSTKHSKEPLLQNIEGVCQSYSKICCFDARILLTPHQAVWIHKKHNGLETRPNVRILHEHDGRETIEYATRHWYKTMQQ